MESAATASHVYFSFINCLQKFEFVKFIERLNIRHHPGSQCDPLCYRYMTENDITTKNLKPQFTLTSPDR